MAPAEAECQRTIAQAEAEAAKIVEDGTARAEGTRKLAESWQAAGTNAKEIFLFQKLETLLKLMAESVPEIEVENVTVIDADKDNTVPKIASFLQQLRQTTGIDIAQIAGQLAPGKPTGDIDQLL